ncbi:MAG TPA: LysM domain-containing protein [Solirubrobacterales bacterium]|nr:LysM domain-containing protein [Solirubrobacterales bacterium]
MRRLHLVCPELDVDLLVDMGDGPAQPISGLKAWERVERAEGKALTDRAPVDPFAQEVPILLDGWADSNSINPQLRELEKLGGEDAEPFRAIGPIRRPGLRYILGGDPTWGEAVLDEDGDRLLRQRLTLVLEEYVSPDQLLRKKKQKKTRTLNWGSAIVAAGSYTTRKGDTLHKIALRLFGDVSRWREIGNKNNIHDPNRVLPAGKELKL